MDNAAADDCCHFFYPGSYTVCGDKLAVFIWQAIISKLSHRTIEIYVLVLQQEKGNLSRVIIFFED